MLPRWVERRFPRYPIQLPVLYKPKGPAANKVGAGWTRDLSEGGAGIELGERLRLQLSLAMRLQTDRGPIEVEAEVVWVGEPTPPSGAIPHGVVFTQVSPDHAQALRDLLLPLSMTPHAGVRLPVALQVTCQPTSRNGPPLQGMAENMSRGGMRLCLSETLAPGTCLEITFHTATAPLRVKGEIAWVEPPERRTPGTPTRHGVRFSPLDWTVSLHLGLLLADLT
ncbi:MAG TPA: PilZ domain-containing protein [Candidatus Methylomirabilis sp.]|nr:PilZ domain-containing protein [Candidatus Methylomirabilis sp.]